MSRYYTVHGDSVYVYATAGDSLIDLRMIPEGVGLFSAEVPWRATPWAAVSEEAPEEGLRVLELLLREEGYRRANVDVEALEEYFALGDEEKLGLVAPAPAAEAVAMHQWTLDDKPSTHVKPRLRRPSSRRRVVKQAPLPRAK
jgi:hypothetical protein